MSNYSVKLTKCGKCQFSLAHLPSEGGDGAPTCARAFGRRGRRGATGAGRPGAAAESAQGGRRGRRGDRVGRALGTPGRVVGTLWLGPKEGREPDPGPDGQDAELLNYEY